MTALREGLSGAAEVRPVRYEYMEKAERSGKRAGPPRFEQVVEEHMDAIRSAAAEAGTAPLFLVGRSMGSRAGVEALGRLQEAGDAAAGRVRGVVCLSYPLVVPSSGKRRDAHLVRLDAGGPPVLFVVGGRDKMSPLPLLEEARAAMAAASEVHVVESGDHGLAVTKRSGIDQAESDAAVMRRVLAFIASS